MKSFYIIFILLSFANAKAQDEDLSNLFNEKEEKSKNPVYATFKSTRIINSRSNETVKKHELDFIISHRFGDAAGKNGGHKTFFGIDNAADIRIAFDYGITDKLTTGIARYKGATAIRHLYESSVKYKIIEQTENNKVPIGITAAGNAVISTMGSNVNPQVPDHFESFSDRWSFMGQLIIVRKFSSRFSLALLPTYIHYNRVGFGDWNDTFGAGIGGRVKVSKRFALIADYYYVIRKNSVKNFFKDNGLPLYNPLGIGLEMETGGHVFQLIFTNNTALLENQFIPYTTHSWRKKEFGWGFSFSRTFALSKKKEGNW